MMNQPEIVVQKRLTEYTPLRDVLKWMKLEGERLMGTGEYQDKVRSESLARTASLLYLNVILPKKQVSARKKVTNSSLNGKPAKPAKSAKLKRKAKR